MKAALHASQTHIDLQDITKLIQLDTDLNDVVAALRGGLSAHFIHHMVARRISFHVRGVLAQMTACQSFAPISPQHECRVICMCASAVGWRDLLRCPFHLSAVRRCFLSQSIRLAVACGNGMFS